MPWLFVLLLLQPDCVARYGQARYESPVTRPEPIPGEPDRSPSHIFGDAVPAGERWIVWAASVSSNAWNQAEYAIEIASLPDGICCWYTAVARSPNKPDGTPVLALGRDVTLLPGMRLGARANGMQDGATIALFYQFWRLPAACSAPTAYEVR
jgi:hypothetical protein